MKWGILIKTLPWTVGFGACKLAVHWLGWEVWEFDVLTGTVFSAAIFVIALMLSGTLGDYRACEGMVLQIANSIETIADTNRIIATSNRDYLPGELQQSLIDLNTAILDWLQAGKEFAIVERAIDRLTPLLAHILVLDGGGGLVNFIQIEQGKIRTLARQMRGNRDTDFLGVAYVLLWLLLSGAIGSLLLIHTDRFSENLAVSMFLFSLFMYLLFLIEDLDNPFEYDGRSSVDVDLTPLEHTRQKLTASTSVET